jgi:hypothetical protein
LIEPSVAIAAVAIYILAGIARIRFRPPHSDSTKPSSGLKPDWIVIALPTALVIQLFSGKAALLVVGSLVVAAFLRKPERRFSMEAGPLVLLLMASAIVFSRPDELSTMLLFLLVSALVLRLATTVDARRIIASLIDGCGLYLVANVFFYLAGLQSPSAKNRIGNLIETTGFVRIVFPLTSSINSASIVAAVYVAASVFLLLESGWLRRSLRLVCLGSAIFVQVGAGSRAALSVGAVLSIAVICFPFITRWVAQAATLLSSISAFVLPDVISSLQFVIGPIISFLAPGRVTSSESITTLENRAFIWQYAIQYWNESINNFPHVLYGFGVYGQYRSGASLSYAALLTSLTQHPELALVHNSFLQQLFDGGVSGWILMVLAAFWTSARLAKRRREWANWGLSAIVAMTVLLVGAMTETGMAPGVAEESFWLLLVLAGVASQARGNQSDDSGARCAGTAAHDANDVAMMEQTRHR